METKEFIGKVIAKTSEGFGKEAYLVDLGQGRKLWISKENLTDYLSMGMVN